MRRIVPACITLLCVFAVFFSGCSDTQAAVTVKEQDGVQRSFAQVYTLRFPELYSQYAQRGVFATSETENGQEQDTTPYVHKLYADFMPFESLDQIQALELADDEMSEQQYNEQLTAIYDSLRVVFVVTVYDKSKIPSDADLSLITGFANNTLLGEWGDYLCYASTPVRDESDMSEQSLNAYRALCGGIQEIFDSIQPLAQ